MLFLRIAGVTFVFLGVICGLDLWREEQIKAISLLQELKNLFEKGKRKLVREKNSCVSFFIEGKEEDEEIRKTINLVGKNLEIHRYKTGKECWDRAWEKYFEDNCFKQSVKELVYESGNCFFGRDKEELNCLLENNIENFKEEIRKRQKLYEKQRKVIMPAGFLGGLMLVVILI